MIELGEIMKNRKHLSPIIIVCFLLFNLFISIPNISVTSIPSFPDQFISEIFPNSTLPLQIPHTNTVIMFNSTDFPHKIDITFDANYTIYNSENTTTIPIILPFSFATSISDFIFEVYVNNTQIPYDLFSVSPWNENITEIDIHLAWFIETYPIILIRSNVTLQKNTSSVIRYYFNGVISNPVGISDLFYIVYHIGTSQEWIGNTTGRVEIHAYGKQPIFGTFGFSNLDRRVEDIIGGRSFICEWNNSKSPNMDIGIQYYREATQFEIILEYILYYISPFIGISIIFIIIIIKRKLIKRELRNNSNKEFM